MTKVLSKSDILTSADLAREAVNVPEWGGTVYVRVLTAKERDAWELTFTPTVKGAPVVLENVRARLVVLTAVDAEGRRLFEDGDVEALGGKNAAAVDRLFVVAQRLNGLTVTEIEDTAKN